MLEKTTLGFLMSLALAGTSCTPQLVPYRAALEDEGELHVYLQPVPQEAHRLSFSIAEISAVREDGALIPLGESAMEVEGRNLLEAQQRLATTRLPPGLYTGLSVMLSAASLRGEDGAAALVVPEGALFIDEEFSIIRRRATALFLSLDSERLVTSGFRFTPVFALRKSGRQLESLLGFVTSAHTNIVSVFNKNTMQIVNTIATSSGPKGIVVDQLSGSAYVATTRDDIIEVIEVRSGETLGRIQLNFGDEPTEIALSPDGRTLVSANQGSNTLSIIQTGSLREVDRISLPSAPTSVVVAMPGPRAYVFHALSNSISAIDLPGRALVTTQIFREPPVRGALSRDGDRLYVITRNSPDLLVIDPASLAVTSRIFVGVGALSIKVDTRTELIYVGNRTGEIAVLDPSSLMFIDRFSARGSASYLAIDNDENKLFVVSSDSGTLQKIDLVSKRPLGVIELEEGSYAVALMGER